MIWISIHLTLSQSCAPGPERISSSSSSSSIRSSSTKLPKKQHMTAAPISFLPKKKSQMAAATKSIAAQKVADDSCLDIIPAQTAKSDGSCSMNRRPKLLGQKLCSCSLEIAKEVELSKKKQLEDDQQIWQCILFLRISAIWQLLNKYKTQKAAGLDYSHPKLHLKKYQGLMLLNLDSCPRIRVL